MGRGEPLNQLEWPRACRRKRRWRSVLVSGGTDVRVKLPAPQRVHCVNLCCYWAGVRVPRRTEGGGGSGLPWKCGVGVGSASPASCTPVPSRVLGCPKRLLVPRAARISIFLFLCSVQRSWTSALRSQGVHESWRDVLNSRFRFSRSGTGLEIVQVTVRVLVHEPHFSSKILKHVFPFVHFSLSLPPWGTPIRS